jgi:hypothetical protein
MMRTTIAAAARSPVIARARWTFVDFWHGPPVAEDVKIEERGSTTTFMLERPSSICDPRSSISYLLSSPTHP